MNRRMNVRGEGFSDVWIESGEDERVHGRKADENR